VIEVYAIVDDPGPALPPVAPLRTVACRNLAAVCSPAREREGTPDELWRHEEIVEALMEERDVLPVRYGTRLEDDMAVRSVLDERHDELAAALDGIRGGVELAVRVVDPRPHHDPREPAATGAEYLEARQRAAAGQKDAVRDLHEPLAGIARAATTRTPRMPSELLRAAYLVDRDAVGDFVSCVSELQEANGGVRILCTGPWPAYSFAGA
jgi:hypothetical protein